MGYSFGPVLVRQPVYLRLPVADKSTIPTFW
jgi:hypothetical protein